MLRTILFVGFIIFATFFLPFWAQIIIYILGLFLIPYKVALLLGAILSDTLYSPLRSLSFDNNKTTIFVLVLLFIYFIIRNNTRITQRYGLEKK